MRTFNLADLFELVAATVPEREALVAGARRLTYAELDRRSNRLARHWQSCGVARGQHVAILACNRARMDRGDARRLQAARGADQHQLPLCRGRTALHVRERGRGRAALRAEVHAAASPRFATACRELRHYLALDDGHAADDAALGAADYERRWRRRTTRRWPSSASGDDLYVLYTGGTTGMPKGTMWRHEDIFFGALQGGAATGGAQIRAPEEIVERVKTGFALSTVCPPPMMHGGGMWNALITMYSGGKFVLYCEPHFDADRVLRLVQDEQTITADDGGRRDGAPARGGPGAQPLRLLQALRAELGRRDPARKPVKNRLKALFPARA